jgi:hypothetical protein
MKSLLFAALLFFSLTTISFADAPPLSAARAATIAQEDLASRGLEATVYIVEVNYKKESPFTGSAYWEVLWNQEFAAQTEGRKEIGLRVAMDGTYKRAVR